MVSNQIKMGCKTLHLFFFSLLILCSKTNGQNISKHYASLYQENRILYYIFPTKGFKNKSGNHLVYDITYLTTTDTAIIKFSYFDKNKKDIKELNVLSDKLTILTTNKIFVETKKRKWHYRYSAKIALNDLIHLFAQKVPPTIKIISQPETTELRMRKSRWKKLAKRTTKILEMVIFNKKN